MPDPHCEHCGEEFAPEDVNVEAFEVTGGKIVCPDCFEELAQQWHEDNGQFGMGA